MSGALALYDTARRALSEAVAVADVLDVRDKATVIAHLARVAKDRGLEADAAELRLRAERQLGLMMAAQREGAGFSQGGRPPLDAPTRCETGCGPDPVSSQPPTLAAAGIGKRLAQTARTYAAMPEADFFARLLARRDAVLAGKRRVLADLVDPQEEKAARRAEREATLGARQCALPDKRYGVILDDPEWRFEVWSRETGLDRAADNHYPTSALEDIQARSEAIATDLAAESCAWFRWVTGPFLAHGLRAIEVGGFVYKTNWAWPKPHAGTGYWNRGKHELLLLATRGAPPCPAQGAQWDSLIEAPQGAHSEKPDAVLEMIEAYFPSLPKIELNRIGAPRPGWDAWGNEVEDLRELAAA